MKNIVKIDNELYNNMFKNGSIDEVLFNIKWIEIINLSEKSKSVVHKKGG